MASEFLTDREAAEFLRCSTRTIRRRADDGTLPYKLFGGKRLFRRRDLITVDERPTGVHTPRPAPKAGTVRAIAYELEMSERLAS